MFQRRTRRFRHNRPNGRHSVSSNGYEKGRSRLNSFSNSQTRNKYRPALSAERLLEKYNNLAKEAMSSGDKTSSENYLQHADHFLRIIEDRNKNRIQNKPSLEHKPTSNEKNSRESIDVNKNKETTNTD